MIRITWRFIKWIVHIGIWLALEVLRACYFILRFVAPWVFRAVWTSMKLVATSVISIPIGLPTATERIADHWMRQAAFAGFPTLYDTYLFNVLRVVAYIVIVTGWIMLAITTMVVLRLMFDWIW